MIWVVVEMNCCEDYVGDAGVFFEEREHGDVFVLVKVRLVVAYDACGVTLDSRMTDRGGIVDWYARTYRG